MGQLISIPILSGLFNPVNLDVLYFSNIASVPTNDLRNKIYVNHNMIIREISLCAHCDTVGSNENWKVELIKTNLGTTITLGYLQKDGIYNRRILNNNSILIKMLSQDGILLKLVNPSWVTEPLNVAIGGYLLAELI